MTAFRRIATILLATGALVVPPAPALGATSIVDEPFGASWVAGTTWTAGGTTIPSIATNNAYTPVSAMRLTPALNSQSGYVMYNLAQPTDGGLDISFQLAQWGNTVGSGADGITFFLRKGTEMSTQPGALGGAMGYATFPSGSEAGLPGGLIGVGFDLYGAYAGERQFGGADCAGDGTGSNGSILANRIAVRGPGSGFTGYCRLAVTNSGAVAFDGATNTRAGRARSIRVTVDPSTQANPRVKVYYAGNGSGTGLTQVLDFAAPAALLAEETIKFGFAAGTGGWNNNHEVWGLTVNSLVDLPPVVITTMTLPVGTVGSAYTCARIDTADGVAPVELAVASGALPAGLTFNPATAEVCGTPTVEGTGTFTVKATDGRGPAPSTAIRTYAIPVADSGPPCVPVNLAAAAGVKQASLSWSPNPGPSCPGLKRYEVQADSGETCTTTAPTVTCDVTGLGAGSPVRFRVRALNNVGASDWSEYGSAVTPTGPPCVPVDLAAVEGIKRVSLSWQPNPASTCPGATRYEVEADSGETCTTVAPKTTCDVTRLAAGLPVRFRVRALNDHGASAWSDYSAIAYPKADDGPVVRATIATAAPDGVVVFVAAKRVGRVLVVGRSRVGDRTVITCIGRASVATPQAAKRVLCVLTRAGRRTLCRQSLNIRLVTQLRTADRPDEVARRAAHLPLRSCASEAVTG